MGKIQRPSDLKKPDKIAIVLCVGSRDKGSGNAYCSAVCCKYAVKDAIVALEHEPDLDITIFFMDMRMYGKGFETFFERARAEGVKFVRSRVSEIKEDPATNDLTTGLRPLKETVILPWPQELGSMSTVFVKQACFLPLIPPRKGSLWLVHFKGPNRFLIVCVRQVVLQPQQQSC
jgi:hypothetical protein